MTGKIDFLRIAQAALASASTLLNAWLPGGRVEGGEYKALNPTRSDGKLGSFSVNVGTGKWGDFATGDAGGDLVSLYAYLHGLDQGAAAREVAEQLGLEAGSRSGAPRGDTQRAAPATAPAAKPKSDWVPVMPVPDDALKVSHDHPHYGRAEGIWAYRDRAGALLGYIRRFRNSEGGKEILPLCWCRNAVTGERKWHPVAFPQPRPLYGLWELGDDLSAIVLIVEGEKCREAARERLGDKFRLISWPGGAKAIKKVDWSPLAGRTVLIWPDCDAAKDKEGAIKPAGEQPGVMAAEQIAELLQGVGAARVRIVDIPGPGEKPAGWDVADAIAEGWTDEQLLELLRRQRPPASAGTSTPVGAGAGDAVVDDAWRDRLTFRNGRPYDCRENVIYVLRDHPAWSGVLGADTFSKRISVRRESPLGHQVGAEWTANDDIAAAMWLAEQEGLQVRNLDTIAHSVRFVAKLAPFHPVREFLEALKWDERARVDGWMPLYLGAEDTPYHRKVGRYFLINMIRRIFEPGCVMRSVPVLEGAQDKGKSRAVKALAEPWFSDTTFKVGDKDSFQQIQGVWVYEISELESFTRAEATAVKAFISSTEDNFRAPYERQNERHARQTAFAATTNATEYLKDWTGNTRFWPVACGQRIDLDGIASAREQLLAEAVALYRLGERAFPTAEEQAALFTPVQDARMMAHPWLELIIGYLNPSGGRKDEVTVNDILLDCLGLKADKMNPQGGEAQRVGQILHALGWSKVRAGNKIRTYKWVRPQSEIAAEDHGDIPF